MPRDGSGVYHRPLGIDAVSDTTIESSKYNTNVLDVELDLNTPRPIVAGGTAATSADGALDNFSAEKFLQLVTNWDATPLRAGSVYAPITVGGTTPVAAHAFAGICYYANATDLVLDVTDLTAAASLTCNQYIRVMTAGVWGPWIAKGSGGSSSGTGTKTMAGYDYIWIDPTLIGQDGVELVYRLKPGQITFNQNPTLTGYYGLFILMSHITKSGTNLAQSGPDLIKPGYKIRIQDTINPTAVYQTFTITTNMADVPPPSQDFYFEIGGPGSPLGVTTYDKAGMFTSGHPVQVITTAPAP